MLLPGKGPIFSWHSCKTDQEVQDPSFRRNYPLLNAVTYNLHYNDIGMSKLVSKDISKGAILVTMRRDFTPEQKS